MDQKSKPAPLSEDWLSVIIAMLLLLLAALGFLGPQGIRILF